MMQAIILAAVLHGCETWSQTLKEEQTRRVFENRALIISGPKRDEVTEGWRKLHTLYSSPSIIRMF
jgi:hypothetical protein